MAGLRIEGNTTGNVAEVTSSNELKVALTNTAANMGGVRLFCENDPGTRTGVSYLKSPEVSDDYRMRVGIDTLLFTETFNQTAQPTQNWHHVFTTTANVLASGYLQFPQLTAINTGSYIRSWMHFPLFGSAPLYAEFSMLITLPPASNEKFFMGLGNVHIVTTANGYTKATDGVWFEMNSGGLEGVIAYNGTEVSTGVIKTIGELTTGVVKKYTISINEGACEFWEDDVLLADMEVPAGIGQPFMQGSLPVYMQHLTTAAVTSGTTIKISDVTISQGDIATNKSWGTQMAAMGLSVHQANAGGAISSPLTTFTALAANTNPTAATPANASLTANLIALLGGRAQATLLAQTAAVDVLMQSWQNPASAVGSTGRTLYITGIRISSYVSTALGTPTAGINCFEWSIAYGHTQATLATITDAATFATNTTKGTRRHFLGYQSYPAAAAIGTVATPGDIVQTFDAPLVINPGEFIATVMRQVNSAAAATGALGYTIGFTGYFQ